MEEDKVNHLIEEWRDISEFPNYEVSNIARGGNTKLKTYKGYEWKYRI